MILTFRHPRIQGLVRVRVLPDRGLLVNMPMTNGEWLSLHQWSRLLSKLTGQPQNLRDINRVERKILLLPEHRVRYFVIEEVVNDTPVMGAHFVFAGEEVDAE